MTDYSKGKIYKISSSQTDKIYIGSTVQHLNDRLALHKSDYNKFKQNESSKYCSSYELLELSDFIIELLTEYPCNSKSELCAKEQEYLNEFSNIIVNKQKAYTGMSKVEYKKDYYAKNKEIFNDVSKQYYQHHKEEIKESKRQYRQLNKDKILAYRETIKVKYVCECGSMINIAEKSRHVKSKKHVQYIANNGSVN